MSLMLYNQIANDFDKERSQAAESWIAKLQQMQYLEPQARGWLVNLQGDSD